MHAAHAPMQLMLRLKLVQAALSLTDCEWRFEDVSNKHWIAGHLLPKQKQGCIG